MKITRRTVLRLTGAAAASLALSSCSASGSAILGSNFSSWLQQTLGISSSGAASSAASSEDMAASSLAAGEQPAASLAALPAYDADPLTGEAKRSNGRIVGVMVNNISNTSRQNARPQRGRHRKRAVRQDWQRAARLLPARKQPCPPRMQQKKLRRKN